MIPTFRPIHRLAPLILLLVATACDPCSGVLACGGPRLRYQGEVVRRYTEAPLANARIEFVRTGGARLEHDTLRATTDAAGRFTLDAPAHGDGDVIGWLRVHDARGVLVDSIPEIRLTPTRAEGDVRYLGWRLPHASVGRYGILLWRGTEQRAAGVRVEFRRTGGVPMHPERFVTTTDDIGRFVFAGTPLGAGELVGELVFDLPAPYGAERHDSIRFTALAGQPDEEVAGIWGVGPVFPYMGLVVWGDSQQPAQGVQVEFRRTGGIPITPEQVTLTTSDAPNGNFRLLPVTALDYGEVVGELTLRPPAPYRTLVIPDYRLETVAKDVPFFSVKEVWELTRD